MEQSGALVNGHNTAGHAILGEEHLVKRQRIDSQPNFFDKTQLQKVISEYFPSRRNLGTIVYNPTTTWESVQYKRLNGIKQEHIAKFEEVKKKYQEKVEDSSYLNEIKYIPVIPPLPVEYSNSFLEVKVPNRFIKTYLLQEKGEIEEMQTSIDVWGGNGGIYTDDSNILGVLKHQGLFNGTIDLSLWNEKWPKSGIISPQTDSNEDSAETFDLSITLLLLPPLESYSGSYRNGINPKGWSLRQRKNHNGLSFIVYNAKWESMGCLNYDRNLFKESLLESIESKKESTGRGWIFDKACYEELREKYKKIEEEKNENTEKNDVEKSEKEAENMETTIVSAEIETPGRDLETELKDEAKTETKTKTQTETKTKTQTETETAIGTGIESDAQNEKQLTNDSALPSEATQNQVEIDRVEDIEKQTALEEIQKSDRDATHKLAVGESKPIESTDGNNSIDNSGGKVEAVIEQKKDEAN